MKELFITFITLAGLAIGITCYDSIMGTGQADGRKQEKFLLNNNPVS